MSRKLTFISIFFLGINSIVGSGIFILPANAFKDFGSLSVFAILFAVILISLFGLCFAEMSGIYHQDGGAYVYAKKTYGDFIGFNIGFLNCFSAIMTWATSAVAFTQILSAFFPVFDGGLARFLLPPIMIFLSAGLTLLGIAESTLANNIIATVKILALFIFCLVGLFFIRAHNIFSLNYVPKTGIIHSFVETILVFFFAFTGFEMVPLAANTMKNPKRDLPRVIISVIIFVGLFYALILFVCIGLLGSGLANSTNPVADSFAIIAGNLGFTFIWASSLLSILGILVATAFEAPRSLSPLAADGFIHKSFATESTRSVPVFSVLAIAFITALVSMTGSFAILSQALSFILLIIYIVPAFAVITNRRRGVHSLFRMPLYPLLPILAILLTLYLIINVSSSDLIYGLIAVICGIIVYFVYAAPRKKQQTTYSN